jgi:hypothetical protein
MDPVRQRVIYRSEAFGLVRPEYRLVKAGRRGAWLYLAEAMESRTRAGAVSGGCSRELGSDTELMQQ